MELEGPHTRNCECSRCEETPGKVQYNIALTERQIDAACKRNKAAQPIRTGDLELLVNWR